MTPMAASAARMEVTGARVRGETSWMLTTRVGAVICEEEEWG